MAYQSIIRFISSIFLTQRVSKLITGTVMVCGGVIIGTLIIIQSQAGEIHDTLTDQRSYAYPVTMQGPLQNTHNAIVGGRDTYTLIERGLLTPDYPYRLRTTIQKTLQGVVDSCGLDSLEQGLEHLGQYDLTTGLGKTDAWCLTDDLSRMEESSSLVGTKLPVIRLLARDHAGSDQTITQAMRSIPLQSKYTDSAQRGSRRDVIIYAEYYGLLDRVESNELLPLTRITASEYENLLGVTPEEDITLENVATIRSAAHNDIITSQYLLGTRRNLLRRLLHTLEKTPALEQEVMLTEVVTRLSLSDQEGYSQFAQRLETTLLSPSVSPSHQ